MPNVVRGLALVLLVTAASSAPAAAQPSIIVRGLVAATGGSDPTLTTNMPGVGLGVVVDEHIEFFGEFAQARGLAYPPLATSTTAAPGSTPAFIEFLVLEWSRLDRRVLAGARLTTPRRGPAWVFAEASGGMVRRREVLSSGRFGLQSTVITNPVFFIGGGVGARAGVLELEAGYRLGLEYSSGSDNARVSDAHASLGVRF